MRQRVRNDYPLLACAELGVHAVRVPCGDVLDPLQHERLALLRAEGMRIHACLPVAPEACPDPGPGTVETGLELAARLGAVIEIQLAGATSSSRDTLSLLRDLATRHPDLAVAVACVLPGEQVAGKHHPRTRMGFLPGELPDLDVALRAAGIQVHSAVVRLDPYDLWFCRRRARRGIGCAARTPCSALYGRRPARRTFLERTSKEREQLSGDTRPGYGEQPPGTCGPDGITARIPVAGPPSLLRCTRAWCHSTRREN